MLRLIDGEMGVVIIQVAGGAICVVPWLGECGSAGHVHGTSLLLKSYCVTSGGRDS